ncbi:MAG TPA: DUF488 family protein [Terriglobales bacterium]|nr:DUF488 family protein [Terriglobales bacterium]
MTIAVKRAYEKPSVHDGCRVLVDRLWPRGLSKKEADVDLWLRDLAPSDLLRKWFHTRPRQWAVFRGRYLQELSAPEAAAALEQLYATVRANKRVTLIYASKNVEHNNAVVLKQLLEGMRKPPTTTGPAAAAAAPRQRSARRR